MEKPLYFSNILEGRALFRPSFMGSKKTQLRSR